MNRTDFSAEEQAQLERLAAMKDEDIDFSDIPETTDAQWALAVRGTEFLAAKAAGRQPDRLRHAKDPLADLAESGT